MNIPLPKELEKLVERLVESGRYSSAGDVVREARRGDHHDGDRVFERLETYATRAVRKKRA